MSKELVKKLIAIQSELKAPKGQFNKFGNYAYRSCEDILEAVKPLLAKHGVILTLSDKVISSGQANDNETTITYSETQGNSNSGKNFSESKEYIEATAKITDGESVIEVTASARESYTKKGMDAAQITGSASSYARKYALNGLFLIDDTKDADATNDHGKGEKKTSSARKSVDKKEEDKPVRGGSNRSRTKSEPKKEEPTKETKEEPKKEASGSSFRRRR